MSNASPQEIYNLSKTLIQISSFLQMHGYKIQVKKKQKKKSINNNHNFN